MPAWGWGNEAPVACCTLTSPACPHPLSTSPRLPRRTCARWQFPENSQENVCLEMKGFTPAAYTPSLFQHLPATARSSGSPRIPLPHLIMLDALDGDNASHKAGNKQALWPGPRSGIMSQSRPVSTAWGNGAGRAPRVHARMQGGWKTTLTVARANCFPFACAEIKIAAWKRGA